MAGINVAPRQQVELLGLERRVDKPEPSRRLPVRDSHRLPCHPFDGGKIDAVIVLQHALGPQRRAGDPRLHANALSVEVARLANSGVLVDVDVGVTEHSLDENRNGREAELLERKVGDVSAGKKLAHVEVAARGTPLAVDIIIVDTDGKFDAVRFDAAIDERAGAVVRAASHAEVSVMP